jgi:hypothetical protein
MVRLPFAKSTPIVLYTPWLSDESVFTGDGCICWSEPRVFEDASAQLEKLVAVAVTAKQVEGLTDFYGELLKVKPDQEPSDLLQANESLHYGMVEGGHRGMVLTQEDDWKEMKLARVFEAKVHMSASDKRNFINTSQYVAHLGGHTPFFRKLEAKTDHLRKMIWICDEAKWIWPPWNGTG